jgi:hypothetical protein
MVCSLALDQRDRARERRAIAGADAVDKIGGREIACSHRRL